jgi:hypothetical protein
VRAHTNGDSRHRLFKPMIEIQPRLPRPRKRWPPHGATLTRSTLDPGRSKPGKFGSSYTPPHPHPSLLSHEQLIDIILRPPFAAGTSHHIRSRMGRVKTPLDMDAQWTFLRARSIARTRVGSCGSVIGVSNTWPTARRGRYIWYGLLSCHPAYGR